MLIIDNKLVSPEILKKEFVCNLDACKGCCCWEGDYGAPLEEDEVHTLEAIYPQIKDFLNDKGIEAIEAQGTSVFVEEEREFSTPLVDNAACAYLIFEDNGYAKCGIEKAYEAGVIDYKKPISCHLYPIRVKQLPSSGFEALNYDRWDICSAACSLGKKLQVPIYKFLEEPLTRKYGAEFYQRLESAAEPKK